MNKKHWRECEIGLYGCKRIAIELVLITGKRKYRKLVCEYCGDALRNCGTVTVETIVSVNDAAAQSAQ